MNQFFANILTGINSLVGNYGWSMVIFTLLIKLLISPLDYKSRKGMRRTQMIQPQIAKLQQKYANDKDKLNQKIKPWLLPRPLTRMQPAKVIIRAAIFIPVIFSLNKKREKTRIKIGEVYKRITAIEVPACRIVVK